MNATPRKHRVITLPPAPEYVAEARRALLGILRCWGVPEGSDVEDAVRLVVSELLSNVVRHAASVTDMAAVTVEHADGPRIRLGVHDGSPVMPVARAGDPDAESGRGLALLEGLVEEFGGMSYSERHGNGGKTLWVELPYGPGGRADSMAQSLRVLPSAMVPDVLPAAIVHMHAPT